MAAAASAAAAAAPRLLYQLVAADDDTTSVTWLLSARTEDAAWRYACRKGFVPRDVWLGRGEYAAYQQTAGAPPPAAGLTAAQQDAHLATMTLSELKQRFGAASGYNEGLGGDGRNFTWQGQVTPHIADEEGERKSTARAHALAMHAHRSLCARCELLLTRYLLPCFAASHSQQMLS